jgi:hypothetical protein
VTLEACRKELADSLEDWLLFSVRHRREELIRRLRVLGFQGPFTGGRHESMEDDGTVAYKFLAAALMPTPGGGPGPPPARG